MASDSFLLPPGPGTQGKVSRFDESAYRDANDNRSLTAGLAGTSIAILTFVLFFLYDRSVQGEVSPVLFQATLLVIVVAFFLISLSSMNFWFVMEALRSSHPEPARYLERAEAFFGASWFLFMLEPALILVTVRLYVPGAVAAVFWLLASVWLTMGWRDARRAGRL